MKISESSLELQASSLKATRLEVKESLSAWVGQGAAVERGGRALPEVRVSEAAREALQADESAATGAAALDGLAPGGWRKTVGSYKDLQGSLDE